MSKPIVVVGSVNLDLSVRSPRIPGPGETILGSGFGIFTGGKGANQAAAAARLGHPTFLVACLGDDPFAATLLADLHAAGVSTEAVMRVQNHSGVALIVAAESGENSIIVAPGANQSVSPDHLERFSYLIAGAAVVLTQLEIPPETIEALAAMTARLGVPLILDPAPARPLSPQTLANTDWLTPNESEAQLLIGGKVSRFTEPELRDVADHFLTLGPRNLLLKLGERGVYLATREGDRLLIPAYPVTAVDTTGAGDAFNGGFAVSLTQGASPLEAARFASAVAAISVTRHGALPSLPSRNEVAAFVAEHSGTKQEISL
jgi:ribokinase